MQRRERCGDAGEALSFGEIDAQLIRENPMPPIGAKWHAQAAARVWGAANSYDPQKAMEIAVGLADVTKIIAKGESRTVEFKRSTGELREAMQTLCAFANGEGGRVLVGVRPDGKIVGQQISEQTRHEIAATSERFETPSSAELE
jgi:hypothetical protein